MGKSKKKLISTILKIGLSIFLLYLVFTKISFTEIWITLKNVKLTYALLAIVFFLLSQWISAKRLLLFFKEVQFDLSEKSNNILYLIGMFYNFFIPGGIGGDAYKIYVLNKKFKWSAKTLTAAVFMDRFMGLTAIGILLSILIVNAIPFSYYIWFLPVILLIIIGVSYVIMKRFFNSFLSVFTRSLSYSILVQTLQILCVMSIIYGLDDHLNYINYVITFLVSSVLSIFSFSGIGVREYIFYQASSILDINSSIAVTVGLVFSIITALISFIGIVFHFTKPNYSLSKHGD